MNSVSLPKLELLQVLRALAALAVVFYHTGFQPGYGAYGVDIFFVLSGVIMAMLFETGESPRQFLQRRLIRIVPLYWCMTTLVALITWLAPSVRASGNVGGIFEYILSLCFIPFRAQDGAIVPVLAPGWTINYEIAFYLTCFVGLFLSRRRALIFTTLLVFSWWFVARSLTGLAGEFYGRGLVLYFAAGMGVWHLSKIISTRVRAPSILLLIPLACVGLAYLELLYNLHKNFFLSVPIKITLPILIVTAGLFFEPAFKNFPRVGRVVLVEIGDASYAIYLSHLFVIHLILVLASRFGIHGASLSLALFSVLVSTLIGVLLHRYFDGPIQEKLRNYFRPQSPTR